MEAVKSVTPIVEPVEPLVRRRRGPDLARCVELLAGVHAADGYPVRWPGDPGAWLSPSRLVAAWVVEQAGQVTGHVGLSEASGDSMAPLWSSGLGVGEDRLGVISRLFVGTAARGHRSGERLLAAGCAEARRRDLSPVLDVFDRNRAAIALYRRLGWRRLGSVEFNLPGHGVELLHCYVAPSQPASAASPSPLP
jgi:ribosomal protein S18 acetylase RimI-like enzyme